MQRARRVEISTVYEGTNISGQIAQQMRSFTYEDVASGESDSITLDLKDDKELWIGPWYPTKGDVMESSVTFVNWNGNDRRQLYCGIFYLDDFSAQGTPKSVSIGAVSIPQGGGFNSEEKTKTWESVNVYQIASEIASNAGIELYYEAADIGIGSIEQSNTTDCKFIYSICESYGLAMKVYANKIVIWDEETYEARDAAVTIRKSDIDGQYTYNTTVAGTYTGATFSYTDPNNNAEYAIDIGDATRLKKINVTADSLEDAERKGVALLNNENKKDTTMSLTIKANPDIVAGINVNIEGLKSLDGKYYVDKVKTKVSGGSATKQTLTIHKIYERIKSISVRVIEQAIEEEVEEAGGTEYTVESGDTLWGIASSNLGDGCRYTEIYDMNQDVIESTARDHGFDSSDYGHWIWPGEVLILPV